LGQNRLRRQCAGDRHGQHRSKKSLEPHRVLSVAPAGYQFKAEFVTIGAAGQSGKTRIGPKFEGLTASRGQCHANAMIDLLKKYWFLVAIGILIYFVPDNIARLIGLAGITWAMVNWAVEKMAPRPNVACSADGKTVYVGKDNDELLKSEDGGRTWVKLRWLTPLLHNMSKSQIQDTWNDPTNQPTVTMEDVRRNLEEQSKREAAEKSGKS
jgi:hypothetical protein